MNYQVVLIGSSGHSRVITDIARERGIEVLGFLDDDESRTHYERIRRLGPVDSWKELLHRYPEVRFVVGIADNQAREETVLRYPEIPLATLIHPRTCVARSAHIGMGTVIMAGSVVNDGCRIGHHCVLNTGSILDHDSIMEDFSSLGPGAVAGGYVKIGRQSFIGIGATIIQHITVGSHSLLGAGATLINDLPDNVLAVGVPARVKRGRLPGEGYLAEKKLETAV